MLALGSIWTLVFLCMEPTTTYTEAVAFAVQAAIEADGRPRGAIAHGAGINKNTFIRRLSGLSPFTVEELSNVARFLNVPVEQFTAPRRAA